jgi:peptidoglycan/xylan/chitin deacetylase (PgdA/CDA1 family)
MDGSIGSARAVRSKPFAVAAAAAALLLLFALVPGCSGSRRSAVEQAGGGARAEGDGAGEEAVPPEKGGGAAGGVPRFDPARETVIKRGNPDRMEVTLTIDDGWNRDDRILDLLQSQGIRCTVFVVGGRGVAESNPDWVARMDRMGWEVCTHTYDHYKLTDHPYEYVVEDIRKGQEVIAAATGKTYPYMRPSGGSYNDTVVQACRDCSCYLVMWSNSLGDTDQGATVDGEVAAVLNNLKNGDIVLSHFGGHHTYEALSRLIPEIKRRGYRFVTLTELLSP